MTQTFIRYNADKFQRLGLLKILVAILDPQRRSITSEAIKYKLLMLLFGDKGDKATIAEQLIQSAECPSWNFRFTRATILQVLDWGRLYGFVGSGNQITERGILLQCIMGKGAADSIKKGDFSVNPFKLTLDEKLYFLYHNLEVDMPLYFLIKRLSDFADKPIRGIEGDKLTCFALYDTFKFITETYGFSSRFLQLIRNLRELIGKIVLELDLTSELPVLAIQKPKPPSLQIVKPEQRDKKRTRAADGEAIPRLELLTDLGLLSKINDTDKQNEIENILKSWRYWVTPSLLSFCKKTPEKYETNFCWTQFAQAATSFTGDISKRLYIEKDPFIIVKRTYEAYKEVKRSFGHTPLESVAILAVIRSLKTSEIIEIKDVHALLLSFKQNNLFSNSVRFAAGNDIDKMFIDIRPSFIEEAENYYGKQ